MTAALVRWTELRRGWLFPLTRQVRRTCCAAAAAPCGARPRRWRLGARGASVANPRPPDSCGRAACRVPRAPNRPQVLRLAGLPAVLARLWPLCARCGTPAAGVSEWSKPRIALRTVCSGFIAARRISRPRLTAHDHRRQRLPPGDRQCDQPNRRPSSCRRLRRRRRFWTSQPVKSRP